MIKVALTNLGKYNEGRLIYQWLELPATEDEIQEALDAIGINEEYEEWFITDYETDIDGLKIGEYEDLETLNELAERYENLDEYEQETVAAVIESEGYDLAEAMDIVEDGRCVFYRGQDLEDVAYDLVEEGCFGDIADSIKNYIDYAAIARDLGFDGYHETTNGVIRID